MLTTGTRSSSPLPERREALASTSGNPSRPSSRASDTVLSDNSTNRNQSVLPIRPHDLILKLAVVEPPSPSRRSLSHIKSYMKRLTKGHTKNTTNDHPSVFGVWTQGSFVPTESQLPIDLDNWEGPDLIRLRNDVERSVAGHLKSQNDDRGHNASEETKLRLAIDTALKEDFKDDPRLKKVKLRLDGEMRARRGMLNKDETIIESHFWRQNEIPEGTSNEPRYGYYPVRFTRGESSSFDSAPPPTEE